MSQSSASDSADMKLSHQLILLKSSRSKRKLILLKSSRSKRIRSSDDLLESEDVFIEPENQAPKQESQPPSMQIEYSFDPWDDKKRQLLSHLLNEHPLDAIARRIEILMDVRKTPEGYNLILEKGNQMKHEQN
jgi:hypothetical protein